MKILSSELFPNASQTGSKRHLCVSMEVSNTENINQANFENKAKTPWKTTSQERHRQSQEGSSAATSLRAILHTYH